MTPRPSIGQRTSGCGSRDCHERQTWSRSSATSISSEPPRSLTMGRSNGPGRISVRPATQTSRTLWGQHQDLERWHHTHHRAPKDQNSSLHRDPMRSAKNIISLDRSVISFDGLAQQIAAARKDQAGGSATSLPAIEGGQDCGREGQADCLAERIKLARERLARMQGQESML